jgi:transcriptional regulator with XRE-family HTH domain
MLSIEALKRIRKQLSEKVKQETIAKEHGVSRSLISDIACGRAYKDGDQRECDPTNSRIQALEAEVVHLRGELSREKKHATANAKVAGLFTAMVDELEARIKPFAALPSAYIPGQKGQITEHAVLHISDCHADAVVRPEEVGGLEDFNFQVACARAEHLVNTTINWLKGTLASSFHFPVLWWLANGDYSSGMIHKAAERSYYRNQFRNSLAIGQLHALMLRDLAAHFDQINVVYLAGNHGRLTKKKDYGGSQENFDYLIAEIAHTYCRDLGNVSFTIPNAWSINLDINGIGVNMAHGDDERSNGSMPWYAMQRKQKGLIALDGLRGGLRTRYFVRGHHHCAAGLPDLDGELLMNGAWLATDAFSFNAFAGYREPVQLLHGMHAKNGATWRLPIRLKHEGEKKGPSRYQIDGGRDVGPLP